MRWSGNGCDIDAWDLGLGNKNRHKLGTWTQRFANIPAVNPLKFGPFH